MKKEKNGKTYQFVFRGPAGPDGKRAQVHRRGFRTKELATKAETLLRAEVYQGFAPSSGKETVADLLTRFLEYQAGRRDRGEITRASYKSYEEQIRIHIQPNLGHIRLDRLTGIQIDRYFNQAKDDRKHGKGPLSTRSLLAQYRILSAALARGVRWRMIGRNPCDDVDAPAGFTEEPPALEPSEVRELLRLLEGTWLYLPCLLAVAAGLRRGEVCGLRWRDIDLEASTMTIRTSITRIQGVTDEKGPKAGRVEEIAISSELAEELRLRQALSISEWVVCEPDGSRTIPGRISTRFAQFARTNGIGITFHGLRHCYGSLMLRGGINPFIAMRQLRHRSLSMTRHYSRVEMESQKDAARAVGDALRGESGDDSGNV